MQRDTQPGLVKGFSKERAIEEMEAENVKYNLVEEYDGCVYDDMVVEDYDTISYSYIFADMTDEEILN